MPEQPPASTGSRFAIRNWRVATRLNVILLIPVLVALLFGGFRVQSSFNTWQQAEDAERIAELVQAASVYGHALINERDVTTAPLLNGDRESATVIAARRTTDDAAAAFTEATKQMPATEGLQRRLASFREVEPRLADLRENAFTKKLPGTQTEERYVTLQHPLAEFSNELGLGTGNITSYGRTLYAITLAKAAESLSRSIGTHILVEDTTSAAERKLQLTAFASYAYLQQIAIVEYEGGGTQNDIARLQAALKDARTKGTAQLARAKAQAEGAGQTFVTPPTVEKQVSLIASGATAADLKAQGITPESWFATSTLIFDAYHTVEEHLTQKAVADTGSIAGDARTDAIVNSIIVIVALTVAFIVAGLMARTMSRSMRRLRDGAFEVAEQRLPALVDQLSRTDPGRVDTRVETIPINSQDEIGEVARAFDQVHREAVRLAAEQALLRGNVNAIFTNLSRRNQGLIQRQLTLITDLENNEADPDQLENLFKMDHLATRMRRNGENLLVLAGEEPGRRWNQPVPLVDVLRAAASEVESYERIELVGIPETEIHGNAVTDLVHLLAELLENATTFSSPQTKVRVTATRLPDGRVMIEIHDKGIGLTAEDFADINHKLAEPPTVDVAISKRMGLFVVGRLSLRHGIRVQLRPSGEQAGTTSLVMLPEPITHGGGGEELPEDDFQVSRIVPEHEEADHRAGNGFVAVAAAPYGPSASDLGFDDSRFGRPDGFGVPDDARSLDPVGRSLMREERRAQLEVSPGTDDRYTADARPEPGHDPRPYESPYGRDQYAGTGYAEEPEQPAAGDYDEQRAWAQQDYAQPQSQHPQEYLQPQDSWAAPTEPAGSWAAEPRAVYRPEAGSTTRSLFDAPERVGFETPGPIPSSTNSVTDAGLPRRDRGWTPPDQAEPAQDDRNGRPAEALPALSANGDSPWRSANDDNWQRAEQAREPKAGGVTPSGLPKRVPKANLVPGTAQQTPQGGPQVSRAPEDVRGRLSNLRRGVQQGRTAGTDTNGQGFGPNHQER